jgi:hypothetical protein
MAQVFVRKAAFFRSEKQGDAARCKVLANKARADFEPPERVVQFPMANCRRSDHERAISHGFRDAVVHFRARQQPGSANGGTCLAKCRFIGPDEPQAREAKVAHGAGDRTDVERIARGYQDDVQAVELSRNGQ